MSAPEPFGLRNILRVAAHESGITPIYSYVSATLIFFSRIAIMHFDQRRHAFTNRPRRAVETLDVAFSRDSLAALRTRVRLVRSAWEPRHVEESARPLADRPHRVRRRKLCRFCRDCGGCLG